MISNLLSSLSFRSVLWLSLVYWSWLMTRLNSRNDLEMADSFMFLIYGFFMLIFSLLLLLSYVFQEKPKALDKVYMFAAIPTVITAVLMVISLLSKFSSFDN